MIGFSPFRNELDFLFMPGSNWLRAARIELSTEHCGHMHNLAHNLAERGFRVTLHAGGKGFTAYGAQEGLTGMEVDVQVDRRQR